MADTSLTVSIQKASQQIAQRIKLGREIAARNSPKGGIDKPFLLSLWDSLKKWDDYNNTFLRKLFSDESVADKYEGSVTLGNYASLRDMATEILSFQRIKMRELHSIKERLRLYQVIPQGTSNTPSTVNFLGNKVFIVHGHDNTTKLLVTRFLEKLDLDVVILHERPDKGRTIIEKLEANSSELEIGFAVVLLTPDDMGMSASKTGKASKTSLSPRARQNVLFELGYFIAKLGRERVRALYVEGVELPSDYQGVVFTKLDASDSWKLELAREIKAAGIEFDPSKIV